MCLLCVSCEDRRSSSGVTESDSAGVRILSSHGAGWTAESAWDLELDLDVGSLDGPNSFARLRDVAPRRAGGLWVLDSQARRVRGFDESGTETLAFGRPGQGPGEFGFVDHVAELPDGSIVVGGSAPILLHRFDADGGHISSTVVADSVFRPRRTTTALRPPAGPSFGRWRVADDGAVFLQTVVVEAEGESVVRNDVLFRLAADGGRAARLLVWGASLMEGGPGGELRLLEPDAAWSPLAGGGAWFTSGSVYELRRLDPAGRVTTVVRRPGPRLQVTDALERGVRDKLGRTMDSDFERALLDRAVFPKYVPATLGLWAAETAGELWVGVVDPSLAWNYETANAWDIFEVDGAYAGRMPMPADFRPTRVTGEHVYGIWLDDLDVPHARRYRILRGKG
jgi:hypothetical protein